MQEGGRTESMSKRITLVICVLGTLLFGLGLICGCFVLIVQPWRYVAVVCCLAVVGLVALAWRRSSSRWAYRATLLGYSLACAVSVVPTALYGYMKADTHWRVKNVAAGWTARLTPEDLASRLAPGMTSDHAIEAMGISNGSLSDIHTLFLYGARRKAVLAMMGANDTLLVRGENAYYVWGKQMCGSPGCCVGAVLLRFRGDKLDFASLYEPYGEGGIRIYHHDDGGPWRTGPIHSRPVTFSPHKTLDAILASQSQGKSVIGVW